jgi:hypothetical protein
VGFGAQLQRIWRTELVVIVQGPAERPKPHSSRQNHALESKKNARVSKNAAKKRKKRKKTIKTFADPKKCFFRTY